MAHGDVQTFHADGRWYNAVEGTDQISEPFDSPEAAVDDGRAMAEELQVEHIVKNLDGSLDEARSTSGAELR